MEANVKIYDHASIMFALINLFKTSDAIISAVGTTV